MKEEKTIWKCDGCSVEVVEMNTYNIPKGWTHISAPVGYKDTDLCPACWEILKQHRLIIDAKV